MILLLSSCSPDSSTVEEELNHDYTNYEERIKKLEQELREKENELEDLKVYNNLHVVDSTARRIMNQLKAKEYQDIKNEQGVEFEILDEKTLYFENSAELQFDITSLDSDLIHMNVMVGDDRHVQVIYYSYVEISPMFAMEFEKVDKVWKLRRMYTGFR